MPTWLPRKQHLGILVRYGLAGTWDLMATLGAKYAALQHRFATAISVGRNL
jgi:hypothetical protein